MIHRTDEKRIFVTENGTVTVAADDILWAESAGLGEETPCTLHTDSGDIICKDHFEKIYPTLGSAFLYCLRRGAVNQRRIRNFTEQMIYFDNGEFVTVDPFFAPRYRETFCKSLAQWVWEE